MPVFGGGGGLKADGMATKEMEEKPLEENQNLVGWQEITVQK